MGTLLKLIKISSAVAGSRLCGSCWSPTRSIVLKGGKAPHGVKTKNHSYSFSNRALFAVKNSAPRTFPSVKPNVSSTIVFAIPVVILFSTDGTNAAGEPRCVVRSIFCFCADCAISDLSTRAALLPCGPIVSSGYRKDTVPIDHLRREYHIKVARVVL